MKIHLMCLVSKELLKLGIGGHERSDGHGDLVFRVPKTFEDGSFGALEIGFEIIPVDLLGLGTVQLVALVVSAGVSESVDREDVVLSYRSLEQFKSLGRGRQIWQSANAVGQQN